MSRIRTIIALATILAFGCAGVAPYGADPVEQRYKEASVKHVWGGNLIWTGIWLTAGAAATIIGAAASNHDDKGLIMAGGGVGAALGIGMLFGGGALFAAGNDQFTPTDLDKVRAGEVEEDRSSVPTSGECCITCARKLKPCGDECVVAHWQCAYDGGCACWYDGRAQ